MTDAPACNRQRAPMKPPICLSGAGDYTLPAIDFAWWNARDGKVERARMDPIVLHVADNPAVHAGGGGEASAVGWDWRTPVEWIFDHWLLAAIALLALGIVAWFAPTAVHAIRRHIASRQNAYLASEAWSFAQLRAAGNDRDPKKVYFALLDWLKRFAPVAPSHSINALKQAAQDPALDREIASIESNLFAPKKDPPSAWSSRELLKRVSIARRRLLRSTSIGTVSNVLPKGLNPVTSSPQVSPLRRPVAR